MFSDLINVLLQNVSFVFIIGIKDVVSINSITFVLISCYDCDVQLA